MKQEKANIKKNTIQNIEIMYIGINPSYTVEGIRFIKDKIYKISFEKAKRLINTGMFIELDNDI